MSIVNKSRWAVAAITVLLVEASFAQTRSIRIVVRYADGSAAPGAIICQRGKGFCSPKSDEQGRTDLPVDASLRAGDPLPITIEAPSGARQVTDSISLPSESAVAFAEVYVLRPGNDDDLHSKVARTDLKRRVSAITATRSSLAGNPKQQAEAAKARVARTYGISVSELTDLLRSRNATDNTLDRAQRAFEAGDFATSASLASDYLLRADERDVDSRVAAYSLLACAELRRGQMRLALEASEHAYELNSTDPDVASQLSALLLLAGQFDRARQVAVSVMANASWDSDADALFVAAFVQVEVDIAMEETLGARSVAELLAVHAADLEQWQASMSSCMLASLLADSGEFDEARKHLPKDVPFPDATDSSLALSTCQYAKALLALSEGKADEAIAIAISIQPVEGVSRRLKVLAAAPGRLLAGEAYESKHEFTRAEQLYRRTVAECSTDECGVATHGAMLHLARVLRIQRKFDEAAMWLAELNAASSFNSRQFSWAGRVEKAKLAADRGDSLKAIAEFKALLDEPPAKVRGYDRLYVRVELALLYRKTHQDDLCRAEFQRGLSETTGRTDLSVLERANQLIAVAGMLVNDRENESADIYLQRAAQLLQDDPQHREQYAVALYGRGRSAYDQHKLDDAEGILTLALDVERTALGLDSIQASQTEDFLGRVSYENGHLSAALPLFQHAAGVQRIKGRDAKVAVDLQIQVIYVLMDLQRWREAEATASAAYSALLAEKVTDVDRFSIVVNLLSRISLQTGNLAAAERYVKEAERVTNGRTDAAAIRTWTTMAMILRSDHQPLDRVQELTDRAVSACRLDRGLSGLFCGRVWEMKGNCLLDSGRLNEAEAAFRTAISLFESERVFTIDLADSHEGLAQVFERKHEPDAAQGAWRKVVALRERMLGETDTRTRAAQSRLSNFRDIK